MQNNKSLWVGLVVVAIIAIIGCFTPVGKQAESVFGNVINGNWTGFNGVWIQTSTNQIRYGSESSADAGTNILSVQRQAFTSGTTTPCAILSPAATSTLLNFSVIPVVGTTTSSTLIIGTSTTGFLSVGQIFGGVTYVPTSSYTITGATTTANAVNIAPSTYVVAYINAATASGGFVMTGYCTASFLTQ